MIRISLLAAVIASLAGAPGRAADRFDTKAVDFAIAFKGETSAYRDVAMFVMPGESVTLEAVGGPAGDYTITTDQGVLVQTAARKWKWDAPGTPRLSTLRVDGPAKKDAMTVHAFVMVPASNVRNGLLNGYRIGEYPAKPLKGNPIYLPPAGFVEVTKENRDTKLSPHFTLKQFLCKEDTSDKYPKYVIVKERLPLKLEAILERVNALGFHVDTLHVMSAYRTPYYNHAIGDVLYSQHQWGSAADIYVDPTDSSRMEDLNGDGKIDADDSRYLYDEIERLTSEPNLRKFEGGLGFYPGTSAHPPFVHVDVRGAKARWKG
jgi:peptidase M15-like protein